MGIDEPDINLLIVAFCLEETRRVPNLEYWVTSVPVIECVLGKRLPLSLDTWTKLVPEDIIEFARRTGYVREIHLRPVGDRRRHLCILNVLLRRNPPENS